MLSTSPHEAMDTSIQMIKSLSQHGSDAIKLIDEVLQRPVGNPTGNNQHTKETGIFDNIQDSLTKAPTGTSRGAGLRRLRKDRPDLYDEVGKTKTVNQAMVEAGLSKKKQIV
ncbi:MAG: hypothetical protein ACLPVO_07930 [Desulfomonilaceae bacterium]